MLLSSSGPRHQARHNTGGTASSVVLPSKSVHSQLISIGCRRDAPERLRLRGVLPLFCCTSRSVQPVIDESPKIAAPPHTEVLICVNKTCKKQGSKQIAQFAQDLLLPGVTVKTTGCLGRCGSGPNIAVTPPGVVLNNISTPARMAEALSQVAGADVSQDVVNTTQLRLAGNALAREGDLSGAVASFTRALDLGVARGRHLLFSNRAGARQALGELELALEDADSAVACSPAGFHTAYIRQVEINASLKGYKAAMTALEEAADRDVTFKKTSEYQQLSKQLHKQSKK